MQARASSNVVQSVVANVFVNRCIFFPFKFSPNPSINRTLARRLSQPLALAHGGAYSTFVKNPVFVYASVAKLGFAFGCSAWCFRCPIGAGVSSFFRLCCWLWVAAVWAWVLTRQSTRTASPPLTLAVSPAQQSLYPGPCFIHRHLFSQALCSAGFAVSLGFACWLGVSLWSFWPLALV